jgi:hypothetical protein
VYLDANDVRTTLERLEGLFVAEERFGPELAHNVAFSWVGKHCFYVRSPCEVILANHAQFVADEESCLGSRKAAFRKEANLPLSAFAKTTNWVHLIPGAVKQVYHMFSMAECCGVAMKAVTEKDFAIYAKGDIKLSAYTFLPMLWVLHTLS